MSIVLICLMLCRLVVMKVVVWLFVDGGVLGVLCL